MNKFYPYWKFFCNNELAWKGKLLFFEDGSFAITSALGVVSLYSNEARRIARYRNAFALENGCICERSGTSLIVHYKDTQYPIPCVPGTRIFQFENAVSLTVNMDNEQRLYFVSPDVKDLCHIVLTDNATVEDTSADGKAVLCYPKLKKVLIDKDGHTFEFRKPFHRVDFLRNGSYIVHFSEEQGGSALYNRQNMLILQSTRNFGILPCGDCVKFEGALIANADGHFIGKYDNEVAVFNAGDFLYVKSYTIRRGQDTRFWVGGEIKHIHNEYLGEVLYYAHCGHFYFAPQCAPSLYLKAEFNENDKFRYYMQRVNEIRQTLSY